MSARLTQAARMQTREVPPPGAEAVGLTETRARGRVAMRSRTLPNTRTHVKVRAFPAAAAALRRGRLGGIEVRVSVRSDDRDRDVRDRPRGARVPLVGDVLHHGADGEPNARRATGPVRG